MHTFNTTDVQPDAETRAQMDALQSLLTREAELSAAIDRVMVDRATADAAVTSTSGAHAEALASRALDADAVTDAALKKLRTAAADAVAHRDGLALAADRLQADHAQVEADIAHAAERTGPVLVGAHAARIVALIEPRIAAAVRDGGAPLPALTVEVAAVADATQAQPLQQWLGALCVPGIGDCYVTPMLTVNAATRTAWREDPALVEAHAAASEPRRLLALLQGYVPRAIRVARAVPYRKRGYSIGPRDRADAPPAPETDTPAAGRAVKWGRAPDVDSNRALAMARSSSSRAGPVSAFDPCPGLTPRDPSRSCFDPLNF